MQGQVFLRRGKWAEAARAFKTVIQIDPKEIGAFNNIAIAYRRLGQLDRARDALKQALRLDPDLASALRQLKRLDDIAKARAAKAAKAARPDPGEKPAGGQGG